MRIQANKRASLVLAGLTVVLVFVADALTPLGVIEWLLYALPLLIVAWETERPLTYAFTGLCTLLIAAGLFTSPPGIPILYGVFNRTLGVGVLWVIAILLSQRRESRLALARQNALLETHVAERTADLAAERERLTKALAALSESEARYHAIGELIPYGVWAADSGGGVVYLSNSFLEMVGSTMDEGRGFGWTKHLPPEDVERTLADWAACREAGCLWDYNHHIRAKDGSYRHILSRGVPIHANSGMVTAWVGIHLDVTERVQAEEELQRSREQSRVYARRLVEEVENERRTIARELHDEAGQSLTAMLITMGIVEQEARRSAGHLVEPIQDLKRTTGEVMEGLHRLSGNLRPASLDRLGLAAALRQHIQTFEQQTGVKVSYAPVRLDASRGRLPGEIETTVYRVVQEALTNIARHAHAQHAGVIVKRRAQRIVTIVEDDGDGFDVDEAMGRSRLGLVGMRERAELMGGQLTIESTIGKGTTVFLDIPTPSPAGEGQDDADSAP